MAGNLSHSKSSVIHNFDPVGHQKSIFVHHEVEEFSQTYDYCMVFPMKKVKTDSGKTFEQTDAAKYCVSELLAAGFEIYPYTSVQGDALIVLIRCPVRWLANALLSCSFIINVSL